MAGARKERTSDRPKPTAIQRAILAIRTSDGENWSMAFYLRCRSRSASASRKPGRVLYLGWFLERPARHARRYAKPEPSATRRAARLRSEERRVGKECRSRW